jgi:glycosyltransferase involved in cell wall biosynthesis
MNSSCALSIIVANYNKAPYLSICLDSILQQTFKDIEVIVADDCSTDGSPEIIKEYEKRYPDIFKAIFSPVNRGVAGTRHAAILQSRGDYLTTLDSDDYYSDKNKLEQEMALILRYASEQRKDIIAYSDIVLVREDGTTISTWARPDTIREGLIFEDILTRSCMIPRDFVVKREAYFAAGGYDVSLRTHEDWDLKIRLAGIREFYYTGSSGTAYRRNPRGLSRSGYFLLTGNLWKVFYKNIAGLEKHKKDVLQKRFLAAMKQRDAGHVSQYLSPALTRYPNGRRMAQAACRLCLLLLVAPVHLYWRARLASV